ncbi:MAG: hypothetical protein MZU97_10705, partial [Bacillus subtilis]|nr:hypothetical protein [Bacillus subtilis]
ATTVQVESMQLNVQSQDSLLIRLANNNGTIRSVTGDDNLFDATQYKTTLTTADILQYYFFDGRATAGGSAVPADAWRLEPVTVIQAGYASVNGKTMSTLSGNPNFTRALTAINTGTDINNKIGKVIQVSFYLFSQGETAREIILQDLNVTTSMSAPANAVVNAVRLSAWRSGYYDLTGAEFIAQTEEPSYIFGFTRDYEYEFTNANPAYYATAPLYTGSGSPYTLVGFNKLSDLIYGFSGSESAAPDTATWTNLYYNTLSARDGGTGYQVSCPNDSHASKERSDLGYRTRFR